MQEMLAGDEAWMVIVDAQIREAVELQKVIDESRANRTANALWSDDQ